MKGTHFEIGSHSHINKLNSSHQESYQIPLKNNRLQINDGNVAWEQRNLFRKMGNNPAAENFKTMNRERYTWLQPVIK